MTQVINNLRQLVSDIASDGSFHPPMKDDIKGLGILISDIRKCKSKEAEQKRVNKELANIRAKFKGDKVLDGYQKKKCVAKLLFIFLLGYNVDFGHVEAINLLSSTKFSEKSIAYMFVSVIFTADNEFMKLLIGVLRNDLTGPTELYRILALQSISNILCTPIAESLSHDVLKIISEYSDLESPLLPSAIPCILSFIRLNRSFAPTKPHEIQKIIDLLKAKRYSTVITTLSLLEELASFLTEEYKDLLSNTINLFTNVINNNVGIDKEKTEHMYYGHYMPWIIIKSIKLLRLYPLPEYETLRNTVLSGIGKLVSILSEPNKSKRSHYINTKYSILFELIPLMINYDLDTRSMYDACNLLMHPLNSKDSNLKGLAFRCLIEMSHHQNSYSIVQKMTDNVLNAITNENDMDVKKIGVDVAYALCNSQNVYMIVEKILKCLPNCDYNAKSEMTLKVAILAEKFSTDYSWYVDNILKLVYTCGDHVSEDVCFRLIQVVTNKEEIQGYASQKAFEYLQFPNLQENMIKVCSYLLGEFGNLVANDQRSTPEVQFHLLQSWFPFVKNQTKYVMLSTFAKMRNLFPEIKPLVEDFLKSDSLLKSSDVELQQRSFEVLKMSSNFSSDLLATIFEVMPPYKDFDNLLTDKVKQRNPTKQIESQKSVENINKSLRPTSKNSDSSGLSRTLTEDYNVNTSFDTRSFIIGISGYIIRADSYNVFVGLENDQNLRGRVKHQWYVYNGYNTTMLNVSVKFQTPDNVLSLNFKNIDKILPGDKGMTESIVECSQEFSNPPKALFSFEISGNMKVVEISFPIYINYFMNPVNMIAQDFFSRWHNLSAPQQQNVVSSNFSRDFSHSELEDIIKSFNMKVLPNVDPYPHNFCSSSIFASLSGQIGILMRLEPSHDGRSYKLTIRSSKGSVSGILGGLFKQAF